MDLVEYAKSFGRRKAPSAIGYRKFSVEFLKIHPFADGNGRLSRVLTNFYFAGYLYIPYVSHEKISGG